MDATIRSLLQQGYQARRDNRLADAKHAYAQAAQLATQSNDQASLAVSLQGLGQIERDLGETDLSLDLYRQAVAIYRTLADPLALAHTIRHVGDILRQTSQLAPAAPCYEEALVIYRNHPETNTLDLANTLRGLALLKAATGDREAAIALWHEAGQLYNQVWQEPGSPYQESDLAPGILESQRQIALLSDS